MRLNYVRSWSSLKKVTKNNYCLLKNYKVRANFWICKSLLKDFSHVQRSQSHTNFYLSFKGIGPVDAFATKRKFLWKTSFSSFFPASGVLCRGEGGGGGRDSGKPPLKLLQSKLTSRGYIPQSCPPPTLKNTVENSPPSFVLSRCWPPEQGGGVWGLKIGQI